MQIKSLNTCRDTGDYRSILYILTYFDQIIETFVLSLVISGMSG